MLKNHLVSVNILFGSIEKLAETTYGNLVVSIDGDDKDVQDSIDFIKEKGVLVEVIKYVG